MCYTKTLPFKFIGVVLWLLNSQWKMHHCDVPCSFFLVFFGSAEHLYCKCFCALILLAHPRTLHEPHPYIQRTATWTAGWWSSMQVSLKKSYSTRSRVQDVRLRHRSRLQSLPAWSRHVQGITQYKMASNIQLTTGRDREIAGLILLFR